MQPDQTNETVKQQILDLQASYANGLLEKIDTIEDVWCTTIMEDQTADILRELHRLSHGLAGSGRTFGYPGISTCAQGIERIIEAALAEAAPVGAADAQKISNLIQRLRQIALGNPDYDISDIADETPDRETSYEGRTVLVVDDDPNMRSLVKIRLQAFGLKVISAFDGEEGYAKALTDNPDMIITDHVMPGASSTEMIAKIRRNQLTKDIPIIVMTAQKFDGGKDYALERDLIGRCGAIAYLEKPLVFEDLMQQIKRVIKI
jgi:CheY-like chemotaxis protein